ncbi:MAG: hypothetical protein PVI86_03880 [Phycisphaerae bacterium]
MRTVSLRLTLVSVLPFLVSCAWLTPFVFVGEHRKKVRPEFDKLRNARVAVLVWTDPSTLFDYQHARLELATYVSHKLDAEMARRRLDTTVVDSRDVEDLLQRNIDARVDPQAVGRAFDADFVIYLEIVRFQIRDPDQPQFLHGRIDASVSVHDIRADVDQVRRYELAPVRCVYPDGAPVLMSATNSPLVRETTYRKFAELVARKFYEYTVEM